MLFSIASIPHCRTLQQTTFYQSAQRVTEEALANTLANKNVGNVIYPVYLVGLCYKKTKTKQKQNKTILDSLVFQVT